MTKAELNKEVKPGVDPIEKIILSSCESFVRRIYSSASFDVGHFVSPIEHALGVAMAMQISANFSGCRYLRAPYVKSRIERSPITKEEFILLINEQDALIEEYGSVGEEILLYITPQVKIGRFCVDFLMAYESCIPCKFEFIAIECDGHNFHEKTKEQAAHDKARDRELQSGGIRVLRFTGSEIWKDALGCAESALEVAYYAAGGAQCNRFDIINGLHVAGGIHAN